MPEKPTIGLQISNLRDPYTKQIWSPIVDYLREHDANLIIYNGGPVFSRSNELYKHYGQGYIAQLRSNFEYQNNVIYEFINRRDIDALIMATGALFLDLSKDEIQAVCRRLFPLPIVSIASRLDGIPSVIVDNQAGMRELTRHFIEFHGFERIAFIRGPENSEEAEERYNAFRDEMDGHGMAVDEKLVMTGDFMWKSGMEAAEELIDRRKGAPQAVIAANDLMAISAMDLFRERGFKIPGDVAFAGFDDCDRSRFLAIPLTTVRQPFSKQSIKAAEIALDLLRGKSVPETVMMPTELVTRASCGCFTKPAAFNEDRAMRFFSVDNLPFKAESSEKRKLILEDDFIDGICRPNESDFVINREAVISLINTVYASILNGKTSQKALSLVNDIINGIPEKAGGTNRILDLIMKINNIMLPLLKSPEDAAGLENFIRDSLIMINGKMQTHQGLQMINSSDFNELLISVVQGLVSRLDIEELMVAISNDFPKLGIRGAYLALYDEIWEHKIDDRWEIPENLKILMAYNIYGSLPLAEPLRLNPETGLIRKELLSDPENFTLILEPLYFAEDQMGIILFEYNTGQGVVLELLGIQISGALKSSFLLREQQLAREELKHLSIHDELTGLFNRRGFLSVGEESVKLAIRNKMNFMVIFIDLDGLKQINDIYGHDEGDFALKTAAGILKGVFRDSDILARIGGDEFTGIAFDSGLSKESDIRRRLEEKICQVNRVVNKPFRISMSLGFAEYEASGKAPFEKLLEQADARLYLEKAEKKKYRS